MALVEVDQDELNKLRAVATGALPSKTLLDKLAANPKTRKQVLTLIKEISPDTPIPEIDAAAPIMQKVEELEKQLAEREKAQKEKEEKAAAEASTRDFENKIESGRKKLREIGYTAEGVEKIEKLMADRGIMDYDAAEALFDKENPKSDPISPVNMSRTWDFMVPPEDDNLIKEAVTLPKGNKQENALRRWQGREINKWFTENRGNRGTRI